MTFDALFGSVNYYYYFCFVFVFSFNFLNYIKLIQNELYINIRKDKKVRFSCCHEDVEICHVHLLLEFLIYEEFYWM